MPRPTEQGLQGAHNTQGFTPGGPSNFTTQVVAPLDVDAAPTQAMMLAKALGKANDTAQTSLGMLAREQGMSDEAAGEAAGALGATSADQSSDNRRYTAGFAVGLSKVNTQKTAFTAAQEAQQFAAANPNMTPGELAQNIDGIFKKHFPNGEEKDPEAAKAMAPILTHTIQEITGQRNLEIIKGAQQTAEDVVTGQIVHDAQNGTALFNKDDALKTLQQVYGPDKRGALSALVHAVGEGGVSGANPNLIRAILPVNSDFGGGVRLTPADQAYLDQATARATEAQQRANHAVVRQSEDNIANMMLGGHDPMAALQAYTKLPDANADFALHAFDWYYKRGKEQEADSVDNNRNTWDMDRATASGEVTNAGQLLNWLSDRGVGNTKAGNAMFQRGMAAIRNFQNTTADDPDFRAGYGEITSLYKPATNPMTGKFLNESANSQQAGALIDYRTEYNAQVRQGKSSTEAARIAAGNVKTKWGDPVESSNGNTTGAHPMPQSDVDQAAIVRGLLHGGPGAVSKFNSAGFTAKQVSDLATYGLLTPEEAEAAARLIIARHQP